MHFRQLEVFVAIVDTHSFSKAAQKLFLTQPTVSAHLNALEAELGAQLILRSTKAVYPSAAGAALYGYAKDLLALRDRAVYAVRQYPAAQSAALRIAASTVPAEYVLPTAIAAFAKLYPHVLFSVRASDSARVLETLRKGEAELGFCGAQPPPELNCARVCGDRLVIVTPDAPAYRALPRDAFPPDLLAEAPFLLRPAGSGTRKEAETYLTRCGIAPAKLHVAAYLESTEGIKRAVESGMGVAILSEMAVADYERQGRVLVFRNEDPFLHRSLYCVYAGTLSPTAELFLRFLQGEKM